MRNKRLLAMAAAMLALALVFGCSPEARQGRTTKGAGIGAITGAAAGALIGSTQGEMGKGAAIGGILGAGIGAGVGTYLDKQEKELQQITEAQVEREEDRLVVTMQNSILFDTDSAAINPGGIGSLNQLADVLKRYPQSDILVKGYTDSTGPEKYNQELSERRAQAVKNYFIAQGVAPGRITSLGFGESLPVASNETAAGRQANRRVELEIRPYQQ
ncbi:MAG: OmpA family protein [Pseudomonadota bacterium]